MSEEELARIRARLQEDEPDPGAWGDAARALGRFGPDALALPRACLPAFLDHWRTRPDDRDLEVVFRSLTGLEAVPVHSGEPPEAWRDRRVRTRGGKLHDAETGLPLRVRRVRHDCEMVLVPGGETTFGPELSGPRDDAGFLVRNGPGRRVTLDPFYIDRDDVPPPLYAAHCAEGGEPPPAARIRDIDLRWTHADAFARWAGCRLPTEAELERALRGDDGRRFPTGDQGLHLYPVRGSRAPADRRRFRDLLGRTTHPLGLVLQEALDRDPEDRMTQAMFEAVVSDRLDSSPFGLRGMHVGRRYWALDVFVHDPFARAEARNPLRREASGEDLLAYRRRVADLEYQIDIFDNLHDEAPASIRDAHVAGIYEPYSLAQLDEVVGRREVGEQGVLRAAGLSLSETTLGRVGMPRDGAMRHHEAWVRFVAPLTPDPTAPPTPSGGPAPAAGDPDLSRVARGDGPLWREIERRLTMPWAEIEDWADEVP